MGVTELAILYLTPNASLTSQAFRAKLLHSKKVMEAALGVSGRRFVYYQSIDDPAVLYLLGDWQSASEHWNHFIPSPENQQLLDLLKDDFDIPRIVMYHVDVPNAQVPADAQVISIGWYRVRSVDKARFAEHAFSDDAKRSDERMGHEKKPAGGWRIETSAGREDEEEWVRFRGWDSLEDHQKIIQTEPTSQEGDDIHGLVLESEVKHGVRIDFD